MCYDYVDDADYDHTMSLYSLLLYNINGAISLVSSRGWASAWKYDNKVEGC